MNKWFVIVISTLFLLTRIPFINPQPLFFDSAGYIKAFSFPNLFDAVVAVHFPLHDWYILLFWPVYHLAQFLYLQPIYAVILGQSFLGLLTVLFFYFFIAFLTDKKTALISAIIISLAPLFWISNVTILYEISYVALFIASLFLLMQFLQRKNIIFLHASIILLCFAIFTHMMVILWVPLYFAVVFFNGKKYFIQTIIFFITYFLVLSYSRKLLVNSLSEEQLIYTFNGFSFGTFNSAGFGLKGILVSLRNFVIPLMRGYTILIPILAFLALAMLWIKNKKVFVYTFLWIAPAFIALQFWEAQLPGRYGILAGFGLAFAVAYLIRNQKVLSMILIIYMLIVSVPAINLLRRPIPYLELAKYTATLPSDSLLIESHFSRRQVQDVYKGTLLSVNEPNIPQGEIKKSIDTYLANKKDVYISSAALTDPYGLYSGPYLHILSLSYNRPPEIKSLLENYTLVKHKVINEDDAIIVYKIVSDKKGPYPEIKSLKYHTRRIDNTDPLWIVYRQIEKLILHE